MKRHFAALVAAAAIALSIGASYADGLFPGFPIVSGPAYCGGFAQAGVPGTTPVCTVTVPAGPTQLTGNEQIPADTRLSQGQSPQTVAIPVGVLNAGPTQYSTPLTGTTVTVAPVSRQVIVNPAGTIAALTIQMPAAAALKEGQRIGFCSTQVITALTVTPGTGLTVNSAPTAMAAPATTGAASCPEWVYVASAATLFRAQ